MKKTLLSIASAAALLGAIAAPAFASSTFHLVVPLGARTQVQEPVESITVSLAGAALPKATVNQAYSETLQDYLSVNGDPALDKAAARWSLAAGALPAGLVLDETTGTVAGTPNAKTSSPASFTVLATYKGSDGHAIYTIEVGGVALKVRSIAGGGSHTCAVTEAGGVKCWGYNDRGQLGDGTNVTRLLPTNVHGLGSGVSSVATGSSHSCAVLTSSAVMCWGYNFSGQLGNGGTSNLNTPSKVVSLVGVASLTAGSSHTCALTTLGAVKCWGYNGYGRLGNNSLTDSPTPVNVSGLASGVSSIASGYSHTCAVLTTGQVKCWGHNLYGQLGDGTTTNSRVPISTAGIANAKTLAGGFKHTCAATTAGGVKCWGGNDDGQLGDGSNLDTLVPVDVPSLSSGVTSIAIGNYHTCVSTVDGAAKCWGRNLLGQLGVGNTTNSPAPVEVVGLTGGVEYVITGASHGCAVMDNGSAKCWGANSYGQLGDNSTTHRPTPIDVQAE